MKYTFLIASSLIIVCSSWMHADVYVLRDGSTIEGTMIREDINSVLVQTSHDQQLIERKDILRVKKIPENTSNPDVLPLQQPKTDKQANALNCVCKFNDESSIKVSFDTPGTHKVSSVLSMGGVNYSSSSVSTVDPGWEVAGEYTFYSQHVGIGAGGALQLQRATAFNAGNFYFAPVYLLLKLRTTPSARNVALYVTVEGGYDFLVGDTYYKGQNGNLDGGLYYGYGFGVTRGPWQCEVLTTVNEGYLANSGYTFTGTGFTPFTLSNDIQYTKTSVSLIYAF